MSELCKRQGDIKVSIAYWGSEAIELLRINPSRDAKAKRITKVDLIAAASERERRIWKTRKTIRKKPKRSSSRSQSSFLDALKRRKQKFAQQRIAFVLGSG